MDRRHSYLPPPITSTTHAPLPFYTYVALVPGLSFQSFKKIISSITLTHCSFKLQTDKRKKRKKKKVSKNIFQVLNNHQLYIISSFSYSKLNRTVTVRNRQIEKMNVVGRQMSRSNSSSHHQRQYSDHLIDASSKWLQSSTSLSQVKMLFLFFILLIIIAEPDYWYYKEMRGVRSRFTINVQDFGFYGGGVQGSRMSKIGRAHV